MFPMPSVPVHIGNVNSFCRRTSAHCEVTVESTTSQSCFVRQRAVAVLESEAIARRRLFSRYLIKVPPPSNH